jgi:Xaa-Pro aminopeptidase
MVFDHAGRLEKIRSRMADSSLDALLVSARENVYYFSGFTGGESFLLVTGERVFLITDFRYRQQAKEELAPGCEVRLRSTSPSEAVATLAREEKLRRIGFGEDRLNWAAHGRLKEKLPGQQLLPAGGLITDLRMVKEPAEIALIRKAAARTVRVLSRWQKSARPGMTEESLARRLAAAFYRAGGEPAFDPIVAAGAHSSHPHAAASDRRLGRGEICLVDLGGKWEFYNSDLTRTLAGGPYPRRFKTIYRAVLAAQEKAIRAVRPGIRAASLDTLARGYLVGKGYGEYFGHGLGHGVGLEVHERPAINSRSQEVLKEGMVFTVEPGVYIPGWGGVRIEDTILVTAHGCEVLTPAPKTLESCLQEW